MKCFQILNNEVLIENGNYEYKDMPENFMLDGGTLEKFAVSKAGGQTSFVKPERVIYDNVQKHCLVNGELYEYPNSTLDSYIDKIFDYIAAKEEREYVPPTLDELKERALNYQYQLYEAQKHAIAWIDDGSGFGFDTAPEDQNNWQVALTLIKNGVTMYKVYTDKNNLSKKSFTQVTEEQMMLAGKKAKAQQIAAYSGFEVIKAKIENCKNESDLKPYLPAETVEELNAINW